MITSEHVARSQTATESDLLMIVKELCHEIVAPYADSVDAEARFPIEAIRALQQHRLFSACLPVEVGGRGCSLVELTSIARILGRACASTAMIWAMHEIQVACLVRHSLNSMFFRSYVSEMAARQALIASVTSEKGVGGDIRQSVAAITDEAGRCGVQKEATAISYGEQAEAFLLTARRAPDADAGDQMLVLLRREDTLLERTGSWDTLGMRGTCSPGFRLSALFDPEQIVPAPFATICSETMTPFSHLLWSSCWLGIAESALERARLFLRARYSEIGNAVASDTRLAEAMSALQFMRANIENCVSAYAGMLDDSDARAQGDFGFSFALRMNNLKLASSETAVQTVTKALSICGMAGYKNGSPYSLGRHLRDAHSALSMIGNERLYATNAALLMVQRIY